MKAVIDMGNLRGNGQKELKELLSVIVDVIRKEKNFNFCFLIMWEDQPRQQLMRPLTPQHVKISVGAFISCDIFRFHYD